MKMKALKRINPEEYLYGGNKSKARNQKPLQRFDVVKPFQCSERVYNISSFSAAAETSRYLPSVATRSQFCFPFKSLAVPSITESRYS